MRRHDTHARTFHRQLTIQPTADQIDKATDITAFCAIVIASDFTKAQFDTKLLYVN